MGIWYKSFNANIKVTPYGGLAVKVVNDTGEVSVQGKIVEPSPNVENAARLVQIGDPDPIGIILESGVPNGLSMWIVVSGKAKVLFSTVTTRGQFARAPEGGDVSGTIGLGIAEAVPVPPFASNKHFQEIGHILETIGSPGLALVNLHWN